MARLDERGEARELLYAAIAAEHQLHEAAAREAAATRRWAARAALAERKEAPDLADAARQRAAEHERRAREYRAEAARHQAHIAALKAALRQPGALATAPPVPTEDYDAVARRLAALEREDRLDRDLAELKRQLGRR
ncbi:MAG TPA: hypothetical protein VK066_09350 [Chloroflexota bacterium]|nr:hypothetical protein [Chloroflexota bacterium]